MFALARKVGDGEERGDTVVIKVKENSKQNGERNSNKDIRDTNIPKMHKPPPIRRREKRPTRRQRTKLNIPHSPNMHESSKEDHSQRRAIILDEDANVVLEERRAADDAAEIAYDENEEGNDDGEVEG